MNYKKIKLDKIKLLTQNPRTMIVVENEVQSIEALFENSYLNIQKKLAKDILDNGLSPNDIPILVEDDEVKGEYYVYEGNRRIAILKSLFNPDLLNFNENLKNFFEGLSRAYREKLCDFSQIFCYITSHDVAISLIERLHTLPEGVSRKPWGSEEKEYFYDEVINDQNHKKTSAYYISNKYRSNFIDFLLIRNFKFSTINRLLNYQLIKDLLDLRDYSELNDNQIELIKFYFQKSMLAATENDNISLSRFTVGFVRTHIYPDLKKKWTEILTRKDLYKFEVSDLIEIYKGDKLDVNFRVIEKSAGNEINKQDVKLSYYDSNDNILNSIDTNICGSYTFKLEYLNEYKVANIVIKQHENLDIPLKKAYLSLNIEETLNLRDLIVDNPKIDKDKIQIRNRQDSFAEIENDIFTKNNQPNKYWIVYSYAHDNGTEITRQLAIDVLTPSHDLFNITPTSVFSDLRVYTLNIDISVSNIISQIRICDFDTCYLLVATSYRAIIELSLRVVFRTLSLTLDNDLNTNITTFFEYLKSNNNVSIISNKVKKLNLSYNEYKNLIFSYDSNKIKSLVSTLNLTVHSNGTMISKQDILNYGQTTITPLIMLFYLCL